MPGQTRATMPAATDKNASRSHPRTGPARSLLNARTASVPAAMNAYTANRMTNAPTVMFGHATETTPTTIASSPRHSNDLEMDKGSSFDKTEMMRTRPSDLA